MKHRQSLEGSLAVIGTYVPRQCGIATFTHDLVSALTHHVYDRPELDPDVVSVVALNDRDGEYQYGLEVEFQIGQHRKEEYRSAADFLNNSGIAAVCLQHEYGIFGGDCGEYVFELLDRLRKPLVTTLHSIVSEPSAKQQEVLQRIGDQSSAVVVMAERGCALLDKRYGLPAGKIRLIHHGVPDLPFGDTEPFKERFGLSGRPIILTFGLLGPGKSIETVLDALARVVPDNPNVAYVVLGVTHPAIKRESGESYRLSLERRVVELGIQENVIFRNRFVSFRDLCAYLQAADIYVTPYREREQITSGTLALAVASGKAVVSTPYWYAEELLGDGRGRLVGFDDVDGFADALNELVSNEGQRDTLRRAAYDFGRDMIWARVAAQYSDALAHAQSAAAPPKLDVLDRQRVALRLSLPEARLDHLLRLTDDTGILQHAVHSMPERRHGYSTDDTARAVVVCAMMWSLFHDDRVLKPLETYLAYLLDARPSGSGRFRNFMSYDRRWVDTEGSDDCQGRVLWAAGYLIAHAPDETMRKLAGKLFESAAVSFEHIDSPRSWSFAILGFHYFLRQTDDCSDARCRLEMLARRLDGMFERHATEEWPWYEEVVTYDNGRLAQALIIAGLQLDDEAMKERGLRILHWLLEVQTGGDGHLSIIGNEGWYRATGERARFDQLPLEPASLIGACKAAYRATENPVWLAQMRRCFQWYLGKNDGGHSLVDFKTRGCYDGLTAEGVNRNQGAESTISWLLSLLIMHQMQTGEALPGSLIRSGGPDPG